MAKLLDELSIHISDHLIIYINRLLDLFDSDCLQMRNCLLNVCVNIIRYCSSLSEYKELRGELFFLIIDQYFLDCNVHVRSHAIGLCINLVESKLIPIKFYCHLTQATIERTNDTSCIVRKHAIQLATKLLKFNPYTDRVRGFDYFFFVKHDLKRVLKYRDRNSDPQDQTVIVVNSLICNVSS
jgi:hypothetical protein